MKKNLVTVILPAVLAVFACAPSFALTRPDDPKADKVERANRADAKADKADAKAANKDTKESNKAKRKNAKNNAKADAASAPSKAKARKADQKAANKDADAAKE